MLMIEKFTKFAALSAVSFMLMTPALAQTAEPKEDKVVAVVNGHEIKTSEVQMAADTGASVHANTVAYRLRRVEDLLGIDLSDPEAMLHMQLALMIENILGDQE